MKHKRGTVIWMAVTADEYELPILWAYTAKELAKMMGVSENSIISGVHYGRSGRNLGWKPVKIELEK